LGPEPNLERPSRSPSLRERAERSTNSTVRPPAAATAPAVQESNTRIRQLTLPSAGGATTLKEMAPPRILARAVRLVYRQNSMHPIPSIRTRRPGRKAYESSQKIPKGFQECDPCEGIPPLVTCLDWADNRRWKRYNGFQRSRLLPWGGSADRLNIASSRGRATIPRWDPKHHCMAAAKHGLTASLLT
jgi:hypothetical protein